MILMKNNAVIMETVIIARDPVVMIGSVSIAQEDVKPVLVKQMIMRN